MTPSTTAAPARPSLFSADGAWLTCPDCGVRQEAWRYATLRANPRYAAAVVPIRKCPRCRHLFAALPAPAGP